SADRPEQSILTHHDSPHSHSIRAVSSTLHHQSFLTIPQPTRQGSQSHRERNLSTYQRRSSSRDGLERILPCCTHCQHFPDGTCLRNIRVSRRAPLEPARVSRSLLGLGVHAVHQFLHQHSPTP